MFSGEAHRSSQPFLLWRLQFTVTESADQLAIDYTLSRNLEDSCSQVENLSLLKQGASSPFHVSSRFSTTFLLIRK